MYSKSPDQPAETGIGIDEWVSQMGLGHDTGEWELERYALLCELAGHSDARPAIRRLLEARRALVPFAAPLAAWAYEGIRAAYRSAVIGECDDAEAVIGMVEAAERVNRTLRYGEAVHLVSEAHMVGEVSARIGAAEHPSLVMWRSIEAMGIRRDTSDAEIAGMARDTDDPLPWRYVYTYVRDRLRAEYADAVVVACED